MNKDQSSKPIKRSQGGKFFPALCNVLGTLIILFVIAACVPLTVPRLVGYQIYHVVSGSMEPTIPVGSVIYVRPTEPAGLQPGEIIAFWHGGEPVTHRVLENHQFAGELVTKGDANTVQDFEPVPYDDLIGRVEHHAPIVGAIMEILAGNVGKLYLLALASCGVMFNILAARLRVRAQERLLLAESEYVRGLSLPSVSEITPPTLPKKRSSKKIIRMVLMLSMLLVFSVSAGVVAFVKHQYRVSDALYEATSSRYTQLTAPVNQAPAPIEDTPHILAEQAPIQVDFDALLALNPDIEGWIYCPDTVINYPVLHGETNDTYLHHAYDHSYNYAGSIFSDSNNTPHFTDPSTIIYGHHMNDNSMFATLDLWQHQEYFEDHPVMWLLTPTQDYKVTLFSSYNTSAYSDAYLIFHDYGPDFDQYLKNAQTFSDISSDFELDPSGHYVMLSTCAYVFDDARSVIHGLLQPVSSAGGVPIK